MKKYIRELISFVLLMTGLGMNWVEMAWFQPSGERYVWD